MEMTSLGGSGLQVSELALGTMTFGLGGSDLMGTVGVKEAREMIDCCLEAGVNFIDTADVYSEGASESVLGEALQGRRHQFVLATKVNGATGPGPNDRGQSRRHLLESCDASLRRLRTDYIDLYQLHSIDELTPLEETLRTLNDLVRQGKVRYIGCSNYSAWHLMKALAVSDRLGLERFVTHQAYYSLVARELEHELVPACLDQRVGVLVWSPLAGGLLSGKQRRGQPIPEGTRRAWRGETGHINEEEAFAIIDTLWEIADQHGVSPAQVAINWVRRRRAVSSVIVGARTMEQLVDNLAAANWELDADEQACLDRVSAHHLPYPYWHQNRANRDRLTYRQLEPSEC